MTLRHTALLLCDLQNDFLHEKGAYGRAGLANGDIAALPGRLRPLADAFRATSAPVIATHFTLVPDITGAPLIAPHLKKLRPFLTNGDFAPGSWGQQTVDELQPVGFSVEKVAYSAFYMSRLEWLLRKLGVTYLVVAGIVTNGGVTSTIRDAAVRDFHVTVLADGCAAFDRTTHETALSALKSVADIRPIKTYLQEITPCASSPCST